jgi:hypothetical protein
MQKQILAIGLEGIGWKSSFQIKRGTTRVSIKKDVAMGLVLRKSQPTFGYLGRCLDSNRPVLVFFPDSRELDGKPEDRE